MDFFKIHWKQILFYTIGLIFVIVLLYLIYDSYQIQVPEESLSQETIPKDTASEKIYIDIKGEVISPGVYEITNGLIVQDIINLAGGLTKNADTSSINLAAKVADGMQIIIPSQSENSPSTPKATKISINTGTISELQTIPGLGPSKAQKIIDYRTTYGFFKTIEEIQNVSGIGASTYEKLKDYITL